MRCLLPINFHDSYKLPDLFTLHSSLLTSLMYGHKKTLIYKDQGSINMAATYSPGLTRVPSAMRDLTSLFGMGRGEHPRQNHHKLVINE